MTKKEITIYSIVFIIIIGLGFIIGENISHKAAGSVGNTIPASNVVTYYCDEGIVKANYATSSVMISFVDGSDIILPQVVSGSGIKYTLASTTFWSEGNNAFITEGSSTTYSNCVAGIETPTGTSTVSYTDASKTFLFNYPDQFVLSGEEGYSQDWSEESTSSGILFAKVSIPRTFMPGTNFAEAKFTVGASSDPDAVADCLTAEFPEMEKATSTEINGTLFTKFTFSDAGAGNFYDTTSYRAVRGGECYAIEYTIHSGDFYNFPTGSITMFDEAKVQAVLESMAQSFKFL